MQDIGRNYQDLVKFWVQALKKINTDASVADQHSEL
jgi:hypothetical protein